MGEMTVCGKAGQVETIPQTQYAVQLVGPGEVRLNTAKTVFRPGPRQILARTEAVGLCFSDLKLLKQFGEHPRKGAILSGIEDDILGQIPSYVPGDQPTVPGHEVVCRVVAVGDGVVSHGVGDRFIIQADYRNLRTTGSNAAFGYNFEGALQEYVLLDERVSADSAGKDLYLIPVPDSLPAAAAALVEPWACVECSYATPERQTIKPGGRLLIVSEPGADVTELEAAYSPLGLPGSTTRIDPVGIPELSDQAYDDIVYAGSNASTIEALNDKLAAGGIIAILLNGGAIGRKVSVGVGRIHYGPTRWVGTPATDVRDAYSLIPANGEIRPGENIVVIGAGGPMGQMHTIRDVSTGLPGVQVTATDMDDARLETLSAKAEPIARAASGSYRAVNTAKSPTTEAFTYYALMAPVPALLAAAIDACAPNAIVNVFAGIPAPVRHEIDLDALINKRVFVFGTSGSETEHMRIVLGKVTAGALDTNASVDAVTGMAGATDGLAAVENRTLAGKIIVYPMLHDLPLTPLSTLATAYPSVAAKLDSGRWTKAAEEELLRVAH
jgi:threonine dehydrogenase-like Zn-dependent dehydrogenase